MKNKSISLFGFLLVLSASSAHAELTCPAYTPKPFSLIETRMEVEEGVFVEGKHIDCKKVGVAANLVTNIGKMLKGGLGVPPDLKFRMVDTYDNAFFRPDDISLNVPVKLVFDGYSKNPVYSIPVYAHEYGHAVLDFNLDKARPAWLAHVASHGVKSLKKPPAEIVQFVLGAYHEFFADVIAVLYTGKGDAVARSLYMTGLISGGKQKDCPNKSDPKCRQRQSDANNLAMNMTIPRDFTARENQMGRWKGVPPDRIHLIFAPARFHIYKYYLSNPANNHMEAKIAQITADAIVGDVGRRLKRMTDANGNITQATFEKEMGDVQRANREFILTLDRYFARAGLK